MANTRGEGASVWIDVVAAAEFLSEVHRLGFTVWDAFEEATRWWTEDRLDIAGVAGAAFLALPWDDPDPLRSGMERLLTSVGPATVPDGHRLDDVLSAALTSWVEVMANTYNEGRSFAHPSPFHGWPAACIDSDPRRPDRRSATGA